MNTEALSVLVTFAAGVIAGLFQIAAGQVLVAIREVALNTRASASSEGYRPSSATRYAALRFVANAIQLFGIVTILITISLAFATAGVLH